MLDRARRNFEKTRPGGVGVFQPGVPGMSALEDFQVVEAYADALQADGLIRITRKHREEHTGRHLIDVIEFERLPGTESQLAGL